MNEGINTLNAQLNPICYPLGLLESHHILHDSRLRIKETKEGGRKEGRKERRKKKWKKE